MKFNNKNYVTSFNWSGNEKRPSIVARANPEGKLYHRYHRKLQD